MIDCIKQVCDSAQTTVKLIEQTNKNLGNYDNAAEKNQQAAAAYTQTYLGQAATVVQTMDCVAHGPAGQTCDGHITLAEALARLNALAIAGMASDHLVATAGQTAVTLGAAVTNQAQLEVNINGAIQHNPRDYSVAGAVVTFVYPLTAGDEIETTRFTV